jgi:hypothetical protein
MKGLIQKGWLFGVVGLMVLTSSCVNQSEKENSSMLTPQTVVEQSNESFVGFQYFVAFKNESNVKFQFVLLDREAHNGTVLLNILDKQGTVVYSKEFDVLSENYVDTGRCTQEFCGIEKMYEWDVPFEIKANNDYEAVLKFEYSEKKSYTARTHIEDYRS